MEHTSLLPFLRTTGLLPIVVALGALSAAYVGLALAVTGLPIAVPGWFLVGLALWTLLEYLKHRFMDHREDDKSHKAHHLAPLKDIRIKKGNRQARKHARISLVQTGLACAVAFPFGPSAIGAALAISAGLLTGYVAYRYVHVACHELPMNNPWAAHLKRHHAIHHFRDETVNFGMTTAFWDHVFGTAWRPRTEDARETG